MSWVQMLTLVAGAVLLMWLGELDHREGHRQRHQLHHLRRHREPRPGRRAPARLQPAVGSRHRRCSPSSRSSRSRVIIYIQEGQRRIPIQYASRVRGRRMYQGGQTFLPLRVNLAGVIPIIFAISILAVPGQLAAYFSFSEVEGVRNIADGDRRLPRADTRSSTRSIYFLLTVGFTLLLHGVHVQAATRRPSSSRKNGGFIPGIRPGRPTQDYLARVV